MNKAFSEINWERCISSKAFNVFPEPLYMTTALASEAGEVAGVIQKLERGFNVREQKKALKQFVKEWQTSNPGDVPTEENIDPQQLKDFWRKKLLSKLAQEIADVYTYLDLMCTRFNIDMKKAVYNKFNEVSKDMELGPEFLIPEDKIIFPEDTRFKPLNDTLTEDYLNNKYK